MRNSVVISCYSVVIGEESPVPSRSIRDKFSARFQFPISLTTLFSRFTDPGSHFMESVFQGFSAVRIFTPSKETNSVHTLKSYTMKILQHIFVIVFALFMKTASAGGNEHPQMDLNGLKPIAMDEESPVNDISFSHGDDTAYRNTHISLDNLHSIEEVQEEAASDVEFTPDEKQRYTHNQMEAVLAKLIPVAQDMEAPVADILFTKEEQARYTRP